jgi:hypothetical protein
LEYFWLSRHSSSGPSAPDRLIFGVRRSRFAPIWSRRRVHRPAATLP